VYFGAYIELPDGVGSRAPKLDHPVGAIQMHCGNRLAETPGLSQIELRLRLPVLNS
jgi:hypothetical protein